VLLEQMRLSGVENIVFASTGSVYGEPNIHPTPEDAPFPRQTSLYGASKLACEGMIQAYAEGFGFNAWVFRFVSLMGPRYSHGCVYDFYQKLQKDNKSLEILGDGHQRKSYLHVMECVDAMFTAVEKTSSGVHTFNIGHDEVLEVWEIAKLVCDALKLSDVEFRYTGGSRGWVGDSPFIRLNIKKIKALGWRPKKSIPECVVETLDWLIKNEWVVVGK